MTNNATPGLGVIMLDTLFPRIPGDIGNAKTFDFPVIYERVAGATAQRVVHDADPALLEPFIDAAIKLERQGVALISTSCGFLAMFQRELNAAVRVPVLSSSLLQLQAAQAMLKQGQKVGVLTVSAESLTERHFAGVGATRADFWVAGMDSASEFVSVFVGNKSVLDEDRCRTEMIMTAKRFIADHPGYRRPRSRMHPHAPLCRCC
jgi:hypothetical protein